MRASAGTEGGAAEKGGGVTGASGGSCGCADRRLVGAVRREETEQVCAAAKGGSGRRGIKSWPSEQRNKKKIKKERVQRINAGGQERVWGCGVGGTKGRAIRRRICRNLSTLWLQQVHKRNKTGIGAEHI